MVEDESQNQRGRAPDRLVIGIEEAAELLGTSPRHVYELVSRGDVPFLKIGRYIRFRRESLEAFVSAAEVIPAGMLRGPGGPA